jgi:hypothetical protein
MRWPIQPVKPHYDVWHPWFAWFPVRVEVMQRAWDSSGPVTLITQQRVWLETVERIRICGGMYDDRCEYRLLLPFVVQVAP